MSHPSCSFSRDLEIARGREPWRHELGPKGQQIDVDERHCAAAGKGEERDDDTDDDSKVNMTTEPPKQQGVCTNFGAVRPDSRQNERANKQKHVKLIPNVRHSSIVFRPIVA